jgi:hypothetical protein
MLAVSAQQSDLPLLKSTEATQSITSLRMTTLKSPKQWRMITFSELRTRSMWLEIRPKKALWGSCTRVGKAITFLTSIRYPKTPTLSILTPISTPAPQINPSYLSYCTCATESAPSAKGDTHQQSC